MNKPAKPEPKLSVRPVFDQKLTIAESVLAALAGAVCMTFLGATFLLLLVTMIGLGAYISAGTLYSLFFFLGIVGAPILYFEVKKNAWRRTVYNFYDDVLEYQDFRLLTQRRRGRVRLVDIADVYERASLLQARRDLTSIYLLIPGFAAQMTRTLPGICIRDVPEHMNLREKLIDLIEASVRRFQYGDAPPEKKAETPPAPAPEAKTETKTEAGPAAETGTAAT